MKIISYNVNGIRAAITKGFYEWLAVEQPDIIGLQEIKATSDVVDREPLNALGYHDYWFSAQKKGYSGVSIFSKQKPDLVEFGMGNEQFDSEGRVIRADFGDVTVLNCYFPSGTSGDERQDVKYVFLKAIFEYCKKLREERPKLIVMGDYNIAHTEIDIHDPKGNKNSSGFLPEEREWMTSWISGGFYDSFRLANPTEKKYSWWSFRFNARANNKGWRIDYICVSDALKESIKSASILNDVVHSDHCPCVLEL